MHRYEYEENPRLQCLVFCCVILLFNKILDEFFHFSGIVSPPLFGKILGFWLDTL